MFLTKNKSKIEIKQTESAGEFAISIEHDGAQVKKVILDRDPEMKKPFLKIDRETLQKLFDSLYAQGFGPSVSVLADPPETADRKIIENLRSRIASLKVILASAIERL